ncbi:MAG TPA: UxaA family hydrolase [Devosia sp.]|nr:UxaA family hydrolase [Devosia sp.]
MTGPAPAPSALLLLSPEDNVAVARADLVLGQVIETGAGPFTMARSIGRGHKIAYRAIAVGDKIIKYGAPIGSAIQAIAPGEHVHVHNVKSDYTPTHLVGDAPAEKTS